MARHASPHNPTARRALIALATAGAALGAGAATASAAGPLVDMPSRSTSLGNVDPAAGAQSLTGTLGYALGPVAGLKPNPLAGTGADPLDNGVGTRLGDFKPITSKALTGPVAQAESLGAVPVVGQATKLLGGLG